MRPGRSCRRGSARAFAVALVALAGLATAARAARADGDPASDVLAAQPLFLAQDAPASASLARRLGGVLAAASPRLPLRVAVIASPADLGAVTALWRRPQDYARFLGQEISLLYRGEILVVMPNGDGLALNGRPAPAADAALIRRSPVGQAGLVSAALATSVRLLRAHGVSAPLELKGSAAGGAGGGGGLSWAIFGLGVAVIAVVWGYSIRARPLDRAVVRGRRQP